MQSFIQSDSKSEVLRITRVDPGSAWRFNHLPNIIVRVSWQLNGYVAYKEVSGNAYKDHTVNFFHYFTPVAPVHG